MAKNRAFPTTDPAGQDPQAAQTQAGQDLGQAPGTPAAADAPGVGPAQPLVLAAQSAAPSAGEAPPLAAAAVSALPVDEYHGQGGSYELLDGRRVLVSPPTREV